MKVFMSKQQRKFSVCMGKFFLFFLLYCPILVFAGISTQVEPQSIGLGDTFRLTYTVDNAHMSGVPDLTPLEGDFKILGTERSMSYSVINGQSHSANQWRIVLMPKKVGSLVIPSILFGDKKSPVGRIEVTEHPTETPSVSDEEDTVAKEDVLIKVSASPKELYVNQQIMYTVKLYNSQRLLDAEYTPPAVEDALFFPLGNGRRYQENLHGRLYAVEEQQYAIYPQKSGDLKISPPTFNALVFDTIPRRMQLRAKAKRIHVRPIPAQFSSHNWLPASNVVLTEEYAPKNFEFTQGETVTRTVHLEVSGMPAQLLPGLSFSGKGAFNAYPEKPQIKNRLHQGMLIGIKEVKVTYLLNKSKDIVIPKLVLHWFNTATGKEETAVLPARHLTVIPKVEQNATLLSQQSPNHVALTASTKMPVSEQKTKVHVFSWGWLFAAVFAILWMITVLIWCLQKNNHRLGHSKRKVLHALKDACLTNEPQQALHALLAWARLQWPNLPFLNLAEFERKVDDVALKKQCALLSQALYLVKDRPIWNGVLFWNSFSVYRHQKRKTAKKSKDILPAMHKLE